MKFSLIDEDSLVIIYDRMDKNTPKQIESLQNISIPTRYDFNIKNFKKGDRIFNTDYNSRAEYIDFPDNTKYVKFYIPLNIFCDSDLVNITSPISRKVALDETDINNYLETAYMRGSKNKTTMEVFLNGEKLPDRAVLLTVYQGTVDVYFQESLLDENNEICFHVREVNSKFKYLNYTWYGTSELARTEYTFKDSEVYSVYRDGQFLIPNKDFTIRDGNIFILGEVYEDDLYELLLEGGDIYSSGETLTMSNIIDVKDCYLMNTEEKGKYLLDTIKQPISKNNIYVYIDGIKICNDDIRELNGSFFKLNDYEGQKELNCYIRVKMIYTNTEERIKFNYKDSYTKINHLYNKNLIHRQLINKNVTNPHVFPEFFNVTEMMHNYPPFYIENLVENPFDLALTRRDFVSGAIEMYIKTNSYNMNHFVKQFNRPEKEVFNLTVTRSNIKNYVFKDTSGLPPYYAHDFEGERFLIIYNYKENKNFIEKIYVDDHLLSRDQYDIIYIHNTQYAYFYIRMDRITIGSNVRMCVEEGNFKAPVKYSFNVDNLYRDYQIDLNLISIPRLRYDLIKFFIYEDGVPTSLIEGDDYEFNIVANNFFFKPLNEDIVGKDVHYMNPFFTYRKDIKVARNLVSSLSYMIDINTTHDNINNTYSSLAIVDIACNNLEIYYNGYRLINGIDFIILEKTLYNSMQNNKILFNIEVNPGDVLSFIYKERRETTLVIEKELKSDYGLSYMRTMPYPIDMEYCDMYLDNVKLKKNDVIVYTNNLVQIKNRNYMKYFALISNVDLPQCIIDYLKELELFNRNSYEKFFSDLVKLEGNIDDIFNSFNDGLLTDDDKINKVEKDPNVTKFDLRLDSLYDYFEQGLIDKRVNCKSGVPIEDILNNEIFNYFPEKTIPLDASSELVFRYATMSSLENCYSIVMISELFGNERKYTKENEDGDIDDFENHPMNQYIYEENKIILDATKETPSMHVFDATDEIETEIIVFGCGTSN